MEGNLNSNQVVIIKGNVAAAKIIQERYGPALVEDRRNLMSYKQIGSKYSHFVSLGVSPDNVKSVLYHVFRGHKNGESSYSGLLDDAEAEEISAEVVRRANQKLNNYEISLGNFTPERRREVAQKAGHTSYIQRKGIHNLEYERSEEVKAKAVKCSLETRGLTAWTFGESQMARILRDSGAYTGSELVEIVNSAWGNNRSERGLRVQASRAKGRYGTITDYLMKDSSTD